MRPRNPTSFTLLLGVVAGSLEFLLEAILWSQHSALPDKPWWLPVVEAAWNGFLVLLVTAVGLRLGIWRARALKIRTGALSFAIIATTLAIIRPLLHHASNYVARSCAVAPCNPYYAHIPLEISIGWLLLFVAAVFAGRLVAVRSLLNANYAA
jgi:hypothetical protein